MDSVTTFVRRDLLGTSLAVDMSYYREQTCRLLTRLTGSWLSQHGRPRLVAFCCLGATAACAYWSGRLLFVCGVSNIAICFALACVSGYITCLSVICLWFYTRQSIEAQMLLATNRKSLQTSTPGESQFDDFLHDMTSESIRDNVQNVDNLLGLLVMVGVTGGFAVACHFIYHAPWYLAQLLVDGGRVRHPAAPARRFLAGLTLPLKQTWPVAIVLFCHYTAIGVAIQELHRGV